MFSSSSASTGVASRRMGRKVPGDSSSELGKRSSMKTAVEANHYACTNLPAAQPSYVRFKFGDSSRASALVKNSKACAAIPDIRRAIDASNRSFFEDPPPHDTLLCRRFADDRAKHTATPR